MLISREQKNYTEIAKNVINQKLENQVFKFDGITFVIEKLPKIKGEV